MKLLSIYTTSFVPASDIFDGSKFLLEALSGSDFTFGTNSHSLVSIGDFRRWLKGIEDAVKKGGIPEEEIAEFGTRDSVLSEIQQVLYKLNEIPNFVHIDLEG